MNNGDEQTPDCRSTLVARQLKAHDKSGETYFAPAFPLKALRAVLPLAMTQIGDHRPIWEPNHPNRTQVSFIDVKRAYVNAKIDEGDEPTFVALPSEDPDHTSMEASSPAYV